MTFSDFWASHNLVFTIPFVLGALLVAVSVFSASDDGGADGGDVSGDVSGDAGTADGGDFDGDTGDGGFLDNITETLHIENIPPTMLLQNFLLFWGLCGLSVNLLAQSTLGQRVLWASLPAAFAGSLILTIFASRLLSKYTPGDETAVARRRDLEGRVGEAVSAITSQSGSVYVRDGNGTLHHIAGRLQEGSESIARGDKVLIVQYQEDEELYRVKKWVQTS